MPTYEYRCPDCAHQYEKREGFDAPAAQKCPKCGCTAQRVIHAPPIVFKGSGFYVTDSRKPDSGTSAKPASTANGATPTEDVAPAKKSESGSSKDAEQAAAT